MGYLRHGSWQDGDLPTEAGANGEFLRVTSAFRHQITADGRSGFAAEAGRYHLYVSWNCPWAHRTLIYRVLKNLEGAITVSHALTGVRTEGWTYGSDPDQPHCLPDTVNGFRYLHQAYTATDPDYTGKVTVPTLWDKKTRQIVNNESADIIRMLNSEFGPAGADDFDFYPPALRAEIDAMNEFTYGAINNGVYRCGFAKTQASYDAAFDTLFAALDELEARLGHQDYLLGSRLTEADWRLFPTLVRFDLAYFSLFKCNRNRIGDMPNLLRYTRTLLDVPGIAATVTPRDYVAGYYAIEKCNPSGIIPRGTPVTYA